MNSPHRLLLSAVLMACCAGQVHAADPPSSKGVGADCVFSRTVHDWEALDDHHMVIWGVGKTPYLVKLTRPLFSLRFSHTLAFVDGDRDGRICAFGRDAIATDQSGPPDKSSILSIARLEPEDLVKLEAQYKTSLTPKKGKKKIPTEPEGAATE